MKPVRPFTPGQLVKLHEWSVLYVYPLQSMYDEVCELPAKEIMIVIDVNDEDVDYLHVEVFVPRVNVIGWINSASELEHA